MKIYFIRHGQGVHNIETPDNINWNIKFPKLTNLGIEQSLNVKNKIDIDNIDLVVVSPLMRTLQTAEYIFGKNKKKIISIEHIKEYIRNPCDYREPKMLLENRFPYIDFRDISDSNNMNDLESEKNLNDRIKLFYQWVTKRNETNIAVVTHGAFLEHLLNSNLFNIENKEWFDNCEVRSAYIR